MLMKRKSDRGRINKPAGIVVPLSYQEVTRLPEFLCDNIAKGMIT